VQLQQVLLNFITNACEAMSDTVLNGRVLTVVTAPADGPVDRDFSGRCRQGNLA